MKRKITKEVSVLYIGDYAGDELIGHIKYLQEAYGEIKFGLEYDSCDDAQYIAVYQVREETDKEYEDRLASLKVQADRLTRAEQAEFRRLSAIYNKD